MAIFKGAGVAITTPFKENGEVDYELFREQIEYQIAGGTDAIIVCGTTGEASCLSHEEHLDCIKFCAEVVNKRIPVIAGTGSNCTETAIYLSTEAEKYGVDGLLVVTPYYNKATQKGLIEHFTMIADSVKIPIISGNISQVAKLMQLADGAIDLYSGNDDQIVPILSLGGLGVISVLSNVAPKQTHEIVASYHAGDVKRSCELQLKALPLCNALFCEVNPIPVKKAVELQGRDRGILRRPLSQIEPENAAKLEKVMKEYGVL